MILTEEDIIFAKEDTDLVLDQLALKNVMFVGKVQHKPPTNATDLIPSLRCCHVKVLPAPGGPSSECPWG